MNGLIIGKGFMGERISDKMGLELSNFRVQEAKTLGEFLDNKKPEVVVNAAGKTGRPNIDWCETHKEETMFGNVVVPVLLATECSKRGIYFVHIGSGCIYEGDNNRKSFSETDEPNFYGPQYYAKTKILAEKALAEFPGLQVRIRMPLDDRPSGRNLIDKLKKYPRVIDIQNSITTVPHMMESLAGLMEQRKEGIYNMTNPGTISAREVMEIYQEMIDPKHSFEYMSREELNAETLGKRSNCFLNTEKLDAEGLGLPEIHGAVRQCMAEYARRAKQ